MKLVRDFVDVMCEVNPEHEKNVIYENGKRSYAWKYCKQFTDALNQL